jgi:hypothetical protein
MPVEFIGVTGTKDPYDDAVDYGRCLLPPVREEVARRDAEKTTEVSA